MNKFIVGLCTVVELGCLAGLAAIGLKRNNDCYKAKCELLDERHKHLITIINCVAKDYEIEQLNKELEELKSQKGEEA